MSHSNHLQSLTRPLGAAQTTADQYKCMVQDGAGGVILASVAGARVFGIIDNNPTFLGEAATINYSGESKGIAAAILAPGDLVACDAAGTLVVAVAGDFVVGEYTGYAACVAGEIITVRLTQFQLN